MDRQATNWASERHQVVVTAAAMLPWAISLCLPARLTNSSGLKVQALAGQRMLLSTAQVVAVDVADRLICMSPSVEAWNWSSSSSMCLVDCGSA